MIINNNLKEYIESNIFPYYEKNDQGHNLEHTLYVINRSFKFADDIEELDLDMIYTIAAYHDIGHHIDAKNHERISANMLKLDEILKQFFTEEQINIMAEAVEDHRASSEEEPRSIYGKIVSSADRNTIIDIPLKRTYAYRVANFSNSSLEQIIEESRQHLINKFGKKGYAVEKMYFKDEEYERYLKEIDELTSDKEAFRKRYIKVNNLERLVIKEEIENFATFDLNEQKDKHRMLKFIDSFQDILTRANIFGHMSASAFVVTSDFSKTLLVKHNILGGFVYPGGHADGEYDLLAVAMREVKEETGLDVIPIETKPFAIQETVVKNHIKRGMKVSKHSHFDVVYLVTVDDKNINNFRVLESENSEIRWFSLDEAYQSSEVVGWAKVVNKKIVDKIRKRII